MSGRTGGGLGGWLLPGVVVAALLAVLLSLDGEAGRDAGGAAASDGAADGVRTSPGGRSPDGAAVTDRFPRDVALPGGDVLHLDAPPRAVLPAASGGVDLLCALLPPERLAGLPTQAERYSGVRDPDSPYLARPRFAVYEAERVLALRPDLVLAHAWQSPDTTARLRETGVPVVLLPDPSDWAGVEELLGLVGRLTGTDEAAAALVGSCRARLDAIAEVAARRPEWTALAYSHGGMGGTVAGAGTTNDEILRLAGLRNVAPRPGHGPLTFEELLVLDPDVIVVGGPADAQDAGGTERVLRGEPALAGLRAVAEDRLVVLDSWLYTTLSHHLLDAVEEVQRQCAPWAVDGSSGGGEEGDVPGAGGDAERPGR